MATTQSITTTYAGEAAAGYISAALLSSKTIANGGVDVRPNVKFKQVLNIIALNDIVKDGTCDFTSTSTLTKTEQVLEPKKLQVNLELCKENFRDDWDAIQMGYSAFDVLPKSLQDHLITYVASKAAAANEVSIWSGADGTDGEFDGFETKLAVDAALPAAQEVTGTTVTASNVVVELGKIVDACPSAVYRHPDTRIYVSINIYKAYVRAQAALGFTDRFNNQDLGEVMFDGIPLFVADGMTDNTAIMTYKDNLVFGTGLMADHNKVQVLDMADLDGSENVRIVMRFTAGVQYANVTDIVTYGITNAAN